MVCNRTIWEAVLEKLHGTGQALKKKKKKTLLVIGWTICLSASTHGIASTARINEPCWSQWEEDWKSFLLIKAYSGVPCSLSMNDTPISQTIKGNVSIIDHLVTRQCSPDSPWVLASLWITNTIDGKGTPQEDNEPHNHKDCSGTAPGTRLRA